MAPANSVSAGRPHDVPTVESVPGREVLDGVARLQVLEVGEVVRVILEILLNFVGARRFAILMVDASDDLRVLATEGFEPGIRETPLLLKERLRRALATLPQADAEMFVLCYLEGYSYAELSELLDMEPGTVASRLFRIRAALREQLSK